MQLLLKQSPKAWFKMLFLVGLRVQLSVGFFLFFNLSCFGNSLGDHLDFMDFELGSTFQTALKNMSSRGISRVPETEIFNARINNKMSGIYYKYPNNCIKILSDFDGKLMSFECTLSGSKTVNRIRLIFIVDKLVKIEVEFKSDANSEVILNDLAKKYLADGQLFPDMTERLEAISSGMLKQFEELNLVNPFFSSVDGKPSYFSGGKKSAGEFLVLFKKNSAVTSLTLTNIIEAQKGVLTLQSSTARVNETESKQFSY